MTYYYYWYDDLSLDQPWLTLHPPPGVPFDWSDPAWHRQQLLDMQEAGVDVALAVYWGDGPDWSIQGLGALVAAREALVAQGQRPPALGLFFDSNLYAALLPDVPELADLTGGVGFDLFANQIGSFFDRVPPCHRAQVDGRPLVFLWRPDTEAGGILRFDPGTLTYLYPRLEKRLGVRPYVVRERTWDTYARAQAVSLESDDVFAWGAALNGPLFAGRTVAVGPGYDDRLIPERIGYVRERDDGRGYARDLRAAVLSGVPWLLLETWNELWEATAIGETAQYGREYLNITRRYVDFFHQLDAERPRDGWVDLGSGRNNYLAWLRDAPEERGEPVLLGGRTGARPLLEADQGAAYFHFALPSRLRPAGVGPITVLVEYYDAGHGEFLIEYDSADVRAPELGIHKPSRSVTLEGTERWRLQAFELPDAHFRRRQYGGSGDFRLRDVPIAGEPSHLFGRVMVSTSPGPRPLLLGPENLALYEPAMEGPLELRWHDTAEHVGYVVQVGGLDAGEPSGHGFSRRDRGRCLGRQGSIWPAATLVQALSAEPRCRLEDLRSAPPGTYRWRVQPVDPVGSPVGEPSDWSFLVVG